MNWLKKIYQKLARRKAAVKSFDEIYNDIGVFEYTEEGFSIRWEHLNKYIKWTDIARINVFKVDLMTVDRVDMEIVYGDRVLTVSEDMPGFFQFVLKLKEVFPSIPEDWDITIIFPAFEANYRTIYERGGSI